MNPIAYKFKTNAPKRYSVRPVVGLVPQGGEIEVMIKCENEPEKDDRFLVMSKSLAVDFVGVVNSAYIRSIEASLFTETVIKCRSSSRSNALEPIPIPSRPPSQLISSVSSNIPQLSSSPPMTSISPSTSFDSLHRQPSVESFTSVRSELLSGYSTPDVPSRTPSPQLSQRMTDRQDSQRSSSVRTKQIVDVVGFHTRKFNPPTSRTSVHNQPIPKIRRSHPDSMFLKLQTSAAAFTLTMAATIALSCYILYATSLYVLYELMLAMVTIPSYLIYFVPFNWSAHFPFMMKIGMVDESLIKGRQKNGKAKGEKREKLVVPCSWTETHRGPRRASKVIE